MKVCVLGLGYIGLPTASLMANNGLDVVGVEIRRDVVDNLRRGIVNIEEPGLTTIVTAAINSGRLRPGDACEPADAFVIAVPTPVAHEFAPGKLYKEADMTAVRRAAEAVAPHLRRGNLVVLESTSPPGTTRGLLKDILERGGLRAGEDFYLAYSPERVLPGNILNEMISNDRVVGGINPASARKARELYERFVQGTIHETDCTTAEVVKLAENTYRDVNIALANELAKVCQSVGADVWNVVTLANRHPRVHLHQPGPGVGGHCIAVDPWFFVQSVPQHTELIRTARMVNDAQPQFVVEWVEGLLAGRAEGITGFLGLTYKADVDDIRESPAIEIVKRFRSRGRPLIVYDPHVPAWSADPCADSLEEICSTASSLVILVNHKEFRRLADMDLAGKLLIDTRRTFQDSPPPRGCEFYLLGRSIQSSGDSR